MDGCRSKACALLLFEPIPTWIGLIALLARNFMNYSSIQESLPNNLTFGELVTRVIWECYMRGVSHAGQQRFILEKVLNAYTFAD